MAYYTAGSRLFSAPIEHDPMREELRRECNVTRELVTAWEMNKDPAPYEQFSYEDVQDIQKGNLLGYLTDHRD